MATLIWLIVVVLFVLWLLGFSFHVGGSLIFLLLVLAVAGVVYNLLAGGTWARDTQPEDTAEVTEVERDV